ncbi:2-dehydropantoate 2-reductase [compost metagenome]
MIATASGFPPRSEFMASSLRTLTDENSGGTSSMLRDVLQGNQSEQEHVLGDMFNRAVSMEINAPILRLARTQMQAYEIVRSGSHHARGKR